MALGLALKAHLLGITGAALLTLVQILGVYGLYHLGLRRRLRKDPFTVTVDPETRIVKVVYKSPQR